ncbi:DNA polymerase IV [Galactobacter caseinivorans]|nr:DNA polymerase IV [Galactobacter caseinivorans]
MVSAVRVIAHVDMDAFFVSVERKDAPELQGVPMIVAHDGERSVVLSASYDVRKLGVHSAQPVSQARRMAPHARLVEPRQGRYHQISGQIMEIFREFTPLVEPVSVDEAFLDLSGALRRWGTPERVAQLIRERIQEQLGLPASVGLAANKFLAKMASGRAKPDGIFSIPPGRVREFLDPLPVGELFGVGAATATTLRPAGFSTAGDLAAADPAQVERLLGRGALKLAALARGMDDREIVLEREEKSLSAEHTYSVDVTDRETLERTVLWLSHRVAERARRAGRVGEVVALKIRWEDFTTLTRQRRLPRPSDAATEIDAAVRELMGALPRPLPPVRLIGVRLDGLAPHGAGLQLSLDQQVDARRDVEATMDQVNARFAGSLSPASLLQPGAGRRAQPTPPAQGSSGHQPGSSPGAQGSG